MQHIVGLDLETTGSEFAESLTLQIGLYDRKTGFTFARDVKHSKVLVWPGEMHPTSGQYDTCTYCARPSSSPRYYVASPEALAVNHWTKERYAAATLVNEVDIALADRLRERYDRKSIVAVGWNVAGFDLPFVARDFPRTFKYLHYRTVDLNACVFMLAGRNYDFYHQFKNDIKKEAASRILSAHADGGVDITPHDAGYDAMEAAEIFYLLENRYGIIDQPRK